MRSPPRLRWILAVPLLAAACSAAPAPLPPPPPPLPPPPALLRSPDWAALQAEVETRTIDVRLTPVQDEVREVDHVNVSIGFSERPGELGDPSPFVLQLARSEGGETLWPEHVEDLYARDAEGALTLRAVVEEGAAPGPWATLRADRRPVGPIHVDYRVKVVRTATGRVHGTRADAGGFEGTGATFLLLPDAPGPFTVRLAWDLAGAGAGATALSSLGPGTAVTATIAGLREAVFMAGPIGQMAVDAGGARLAGAWLGRPAFDPLEAIPWVMRARAAQRAFFHDGDPEAFSVFLRVVPYVETWDLDARASGLLFLAGQHVAFGGDLRLAIGAALLRRPLAATGAPAALIDGLAIHYARELLLRAGLATPAELADDLRAHAEDRGALYAAELDAAVRAGSRGRRSLDDLVRTLVERARAGAPLPADAWRAIVGAELGPDGQARYDAVIVRGEPAAPPADAYGPCFKGTKGKGKAAALTWTRDPKIPDAACARTGTP